jgi:hypothetical protein
LKQKLDTLEHSVAQFVGRPPFNLYHGHPLAGAWGMPPMGDPGGGAGETESLNSENPSCITKY